MRASRGWASALDHSLGVVNGSFRAQEKRFLAARATRAEQDRTEQGPQTPHSSAVGSAVDRQSLG
jgi:hypothetical protein